jgi:hypothetical protein
MSNTREVEATLEQDQFHRQRHQREEGAAEQLVRLDDAGDGAEQQSGDQERDDRRDLDAPRDPLCEHSRSEDQRERRTDGRFSRCPHRCRHSRPSTGTRQEDGGHPGRA